MNTSPSPSSFGVTTSYPMASPVPESSLDSVITLDLNVKLTAFLLTTMLIIYLSFKQGWMQLRHIRMLFHAVFGTIQSFLLFWRGHAPTPIGTTNDVPIDDIPTAINCKEYSNSTSHTLNTLPASVYHPSDLTGRIHPESTEQHGAERSTTANPEVHEDCIGICVDVDLEWYALCVWFVTFHPALTLP